MEIATELENHSQQQLLVNFKRCKRDTRQSHSNESTVSEKVNKSLYPISKSTRQNSFKSLELSKKITETTRFQARMARGEIFEELQLLLEGNSKPIQHFFFFLIKIRFFFVFQKQSYPTMSRQVVFSFAKLLR
ncbi:hypothetical protein BY458DRAFT_503627 [Sporodiniella umbellata]|nr:hypothetical protein BY458DRAFT_503627 [Sporodiniella umbellata]